MDPKSIPGTPMYIFEHIQHVAEDESHTQSMIKSIIVAADQYCDFDDNQQRVLAKVLTKLLSKV